MSEPKQKPYVETMSLNGAMIPMEIDTGASRTVLSEGTVARLEVEIKPTNSNLATYTGEKIPVKGECLVKVLQDNTQSQERVAVVVEGKGPNLIGRDWFKHVKPNMKF